MDSIEFQSLVEAGAERRDLEFKMAFSWKPSSEIDFIQAKTILGIIALSNIEYGGRLVVGIGQDVKDGCRFNFDGLDDDELISFKNVEGIKGVVDSFVYTHTNFTLQTAELKEKSYVVFNVEQFEDYPLVTKKDCIIKDDKGKEKIIFEKDCIYSRTKKSPYGSCRSSYYEIRELIDVSVAETIKIYQRRGIVPKKGTSKALSEKKSDEEKYEKQNKDLDL